MFLSIYVMNTGSSSCLVYTWF